jgi:geranylgeranyl diphosphate synthase type II
MLSPGFLEYLKERQELIKQALSRYVPRLGNYAARVTEAMHYSLFAGGKRLRPILLLASAEAVGGKAEDYLPAACALECIHTYSLIHDDLPAMDDDDLRRGRPTCHRAFDEATAILAGDGLLTYAFELLSHPELVIKVPAERLLRVIHLIAGAAGIFGMVGGQMADLLAEGREVQAEELDFIHAHKTGALIVASVVAGAILAGAEPEEEEALRTYGRAIGKAFQIVDDLLDILGDEEVIGKPVGSDLAKGKATYPALYGIEASREKAKALVEEALEALKAFDQRAEPLRDIARYIVERKL